MSVAFSLNRRGLFELLPIYKFSSAYTALNKSMVVWGGCTEAYISSLLYQTSLGRGDRLHGKCKAISLLRAGSRQLIDPNYYLHNTLDRCGAMLSKRFNQGKTNFFTL
jgi:hypothetical protein